LELRRREAWEGEVQTELAGSDFSWRVVGSWLEHGHA